MIIDNETIFENILSLKEIEYVYEDYNHLNGRRVLNIPESICKSYWERKKVIEDFPKEIIKERKDIIYKERRIKSLKL